MLSKEYKESVERSFHTFCKAVLHNEACNYYRERTRKIQHEISYEYLQENTPFAPHIMDEYYVLQDKPTAFAVNEQTLKLGRQGFYTRTPQDGVLPRNKTGVPPFKRYARF